jgi:IS1 family transposase
MCEIKIEVYCPHCSSAKVVKNGKKSTGKQNFKCKGCGKQFQHEYVYHGADIRTKHLIISMLLRNCGIRDIAIILQVSTQLVLKLLILEGQKCEIIPEHQDYKSVQIDEFWSYVKRKKQGKLWIIYAYCPETGEVLGYVMGKRDAKTTKKLYKQLKKLNIETYYFDNWRTFKKVFAKENCVIGKQGTKHIEGVNNSFRARNRRFVRMTTCFSKKVEYHQAAFAIIVQQRNYAYHTF